MNFPFRAAGDRAVAAQPRPTARTPAIEKVEMWAATRSIWAGVGSRTKPRRCAIGFGK
jgi:hypothetical protein